MRFWTNKVDYISFETAFILLLKYEGCLVAVLYFITDISKSILAARTLTIYDHVTHNSRTLDAHFIRTAGASRVNCM